MNTPSSMARGLDGFDPAAARLQSLQRAAEVLGHELRQNGEYSGVGITIAGDCLRVGASDGGWVDRERGAAGAAPQPGITAAVQRCVPALAHEIGCAFAEAVQRALSGGA